ncbi:MAG: hypothetical protein H6667_18425 [Ardenticatenaceae bacterium]|nr:hypothetical protein [Ardenticatenaceae bacterium]MCB9445752.1 hypothetical protein [Ardenticatenaceae bacterium]
MNTVISSKIVYAGIGFLLTLISGVALSKAGRPLNSAIFTVHKLVAVGTIILIGVNIRNLYQSVNIQALYPVLITVTGLLFLVLVVSGALLSFDKLVIPATLRIHQIGLLLALAFSTLSIYLLVSSKS